MRIGEWVVIIGAISFGVSMFMCAVLLFMQTRDRIYTDMNSRVSELEVKVFNISMELKNIK